MDQIAEAAERLHRADTLPDVLGAAFDAFEAIRLFARAGQDQDPGLFAAFMATASAAVDGREALTAAPSLPPDPSSTPTAGPAMAGTTTREQAAALAAVLRERLQEAARHARTAADQQSCAVAAQSAERIASFMSGDGDDRLW